MKATGVAWTKLAPIADLTELALRRASGELICAAAGAEVHVHLQAGRIAWATDSRHAFAFTRYLQEHAAVSNQQLREVYDECRRNNLPLGETLVSWNLASFEQVRGALSHQIRGAIAQLAALDRADSVFLRRGREYQQYATELTFDLSEFVADLPLAPSANSTRPRGVVHQIREAVNDVSWVELLDGSGVVDRDPWSDEPRTPAALIQSTLLDDAKLVTVRTGRGTLVGAALAEQRTLWCRVPAGSTFGSAISALSALAGLETAATNAAPTPTRAPSWMLGEASLVSELMAFLERAVDLVAVVWVTPSQGRVGAGKGDVEANFCMDIIDRRSAVFDVSPEAFVDPLRSEVDGSEPGFHLRSLATAERGAWCFAAELGALAGSLWLFLRRSASPGLGFAYLSALARQLEALPR